MTSLRPSVAIVAALALVAAGTAAGQGIPVAANCTAVLNASHPAVSMFVVPNGSGTPLNACFAQGGATATAVIQVTLVDASGLPAVGVSNRDIRIEEVGSLMAWCPNSWYPPPTHAPNCADGPSNAAGQAQFSLAYHGGGNQFGGIQVFVREANGLFAPIPGVLPVHMNSPDLNGDLINNLSDIALFAQDIGSTAYRSDFNWDGQINLTDLVLFAQTIAAGCP